MHRRTLLRVAPASLLLSSLSLRPQPARAEFLLIAIAVVSLILSVVKLFTSQGNGAALQWYEIQMLAAISEKLDSVRDQLNSIVARLDELKTLVNNLPSKVVIEDRTDRISGICLQYKRLLAEMLDYRKTHGIQQANDKYVPEITTICLLPLDSARSDLISSYPSSFALIPHLATCAKIELDMRVLVGNDSGRMLACLQEYRSWFKTVTASDSATSLDGVTADCVKQRDQLIAQYVKVTDSYCKSLYREQTEGVYEYQDTYHNGEMRLTKIAEFKSRVAQLVHDQLEVKRLPFTDPGVVDALKGMQDNHLFDKISVPMQETTFFPFGGQAWMGLVEAVRPGDQPVVDKANRNDKEKQQAIQQHVTWDSLPSFPDCNHDILNIRGKYRDEAAQMTDLELRIMALRAWHYGSDAALAFLDKREAEIKALPVRPVVTGRRG